MLIDKPVSTGDINFTFDEENIIGGINITLTNKTNMANKVKVNYFDPERDWNPNVRIVDVPAYRVAALDGVNNILEKEVELPMVSDYNRAAYIGRLYLNQSRYGTVVQFNGAPSALVCDVGDVVYVKHPTPNWGYDSTVVDEFGVGKKFKIVNLKLRDSGPVEITAVEYVDSVYTDLGNIPAQATARPLGTYFAEFFAPLQNPVGAPSNLIATNTPKDSTSAMTVSFTASTDPRVIDYVVEYTNNESNVSQQVITTNTTLTITGVDNATLYTVRVFGRTADGRQSAALE
jgi:hypothetical protein